MAPRGAWHLLDSARCSGGVCRGLSQHWAGSSEATQPLPQLAGVTCWGVQGLPQMPLPGSQGSLLYPHILGSQWTSVEWMIVFLRESPGCFWKARQGPRHRAVRDAGDVGAPLCPSIPSGATDLHPRPHRPGTLPGLPSELPQNTYLSRSSSRRQLGGLSPFEGCNTDSWAWTRVQGQWDTLALQ